MTIYQRGRITPLVKFRVRNRDGHQCQDCGREPRENEDNLHVHRKIPGSRYTVRGCVTLCPRCHKLRHSTNSNPSKPPRKRFGATLSFEMRNDLKDFVRQFAAESGMSMNDFIAHTLANKLGRPELGGSPRKGKPGRPPNRIVHAKPANGHHRKNGK